MAWGVWSGVLLWWLGTGGWLHLKGSIVLSSSQVLITSSQTSKSTDSLVDWTCRRQTSKFISEAKKNGWGHSKLDTVTQVPSSTRPDCHGCGWCPWLLVGHRRNNIARAIPRGKGYLPLETTNNLSEDLLILYCCLLWRALINLSQGKAIDTTSLTLVIGKKKWFEVLDMLRKGQNFLFFLIILIGEVCWW